MANAQEFINLFNSPGGSVVINDKVVTGQVLLNQENYNCIHATLSNITFEDGFNVDGVNLGIGLKFEKCTFKAPLTFTSGQSLPSGLSSPAIVAGGQDIGIDAKSLQKNSSITSNIIIDECQVPALEVWGSSPVTLEGGLEIRNKSVVGSVYITGLSATNVGITIDDSSFESEFSISHFESEKGGIKISNSKFHSRIDITDFKLCHCIFDHNDIKAPVSMTPNFSISECKKLTFEGGVFNDTVTIWAVFTDEFKISNGAAFRDTFKIDLHSHEHDIPASIDCLSISDAVFEQGLLIEGDVGQDQRCSLRSFSLISSLNQSGSLKLSDCLISQATMSGDIHKVSINYDNCEISGVALVGDNHIGSIMFKDCQIATINFSSTNQKGSIMFRACQLSNVSFEDFSNFGNVQISLCKVVPYADSNFVVKRSDLGKTRLFNFSFKAFNKVSITDSDISGMLATGVVWFKDEALNTDLPWDDRASLSREIYRQLKQASEKQGDRIQALDFQALEMRAFNQQLKAEERWWKNDRMILWLSQSNDFGLNWHKPLLIILLINIGFYILISIAATPDLDWLPANEWSEIRYTLTVLCDKLYVFPQLFNPARAIDRMFGESAQHFPFFFYLLDALQRIVLTFFIVQIVSAFRKYFK